MRKVFGGSCAALIDTGRLVQLFYESGSFGETLLFVALGRPVTVRGRCPSPVSVLSTDGEESVCKHPRIEILQVGMGAAGTPNCWFPVLGKRVEPGWQRR